MLNSRILVALMGALSSLGPTARLWNQQPAPPVPPEGYKGNSRSRLGTRSNRCYAHKAVELVHMVPGRYEWDSVNGYGLVAETRTHLNVPMRRAERKGVPGVPRGFGDKNAIRF